jgi:hypothetical protein
MVSPRRRHFALLPLVAVPRACFDAAGPPSIKAVAPRARGRRSVRPAAYLRCAHVHRPSARRRRRQHFAARDGRRVGGGGGAPPTSSPRSGGGGSAAAAAAAVARGSSSSSSRGRALLRAAHWPVGRCRDLARVWVDAGVAPCSGGQGSVLPLPPLSSCRSLRSAPVALERPRSVLGGGHICPATSARGCGRASPAPGTC